MLGYGCNLPISKPIEAISNMNPKGKNCSIAALILGIVSIVLCFPYILSALAMACGIVGIICATNGQKYCLEAGQPTGLATAGLVLSISGLTLSAISVFTCTLCVTCVGFVL